MMFETNIISRNGSDAVSLSAALDQAQTSLPHPIAVEHNDVLDQILEKLTPIDFRIEANLASDENLTTKHLVVLTVNRILAAADELGLGLCRSENLLYSYNGQYWQRITGDSLESFLGEAAERIGVDPITAQHYSFREHLMKQFNSKAQQPTPNYSADTILVNLTNGTFEVNMNQRRLRRFRPDDFLRYQLPFAVARDATCPMWQRFLDRVLPDKSCQDVLAEYFAYIFTDLKLEQTLLLYGSGANGKSVCFEVLRALLGTENVTHYSMASLNGDYQRAMLSGKLLNYSSEMSTSFDSELFKKLTSGEPVEARLPYEKPFIMRRYARLAFNCNELPRDVEQSEAFFRRFLVIPFNVKIPEQERDTELANKIIESELSGVFNWILAGLDRLAQRGRFSNCPASQEVLDRYRMESDSVAMFIDELGYQKTTELRQATKRAAMFDKYKKYCSDNRYHPVSDRNFRRRLENLGFQSTRHGKGQIIFATCNTTDMSLARIKQRTEMMGAGSVGSVTN